MISACHKTERTEFFVLGVDDKSLAVGFDKIEELPLPCTSIETYLNKKEEELIKKVEIYVNDLDYVSLSLDDQLLSEDIVADCNSFNGELIKNNGNACLLTKEVNERVTYVLMTGDVLADDNNKLDRLVIAYDIEEQK